MRLLCSPWQVIVLIVHFHHLQIEVTTTLLSLTAATSRSRLYCPLCCFPLVTEDSPTILLLSRYISGEGIEPILWTMQLINRLYIQVQAVQLLGPPARFEASKLKVVYMGEEADRYAGIVPRNYILSHCDFTANLTLTISNAINFYQLKGWYNKDDVVAEWNDMKGDICLDVHCYVGGPNIFPDLAAEFRYHVFSKELPLVLKAVLHGDSILFKEHQELMDATVRVYFHSSSKKYNRVECWGPLKAAAQEIQSGEIHCFFLTSRKEVSNPIKRWGSAKSIFQAFVAFLL